MVSPAFAVRNSVTPPESQTAEELRMVSPELCGIMEDPLPSACGASPPHCT